MVHVFNPSTLINLYEFEVSLVYRASSRTVRAIIQRNPVSGGKKSMVMMIRA